MQSTHTRHIRDNRRGPRTDEWETDNNKRPAAQVRVARQRLLPAPPAAIARQADAPGSATRWQAPRIGAAAQERPVVTLGFVHHKGPARRSTATSQREIEPGFSPPALRCGPRRDIRFSPSQATEDFAAEDRPGVGRGGAAGRCHLRQPPHADTARRNAAG